MGIKPNSGAVIQGIAKVFMWIGIVGSAILAMSAGLAVGSSNVLLGLLIGVVIIGIGALISWLSTRLLQGFGELVQYAAETASYLKVLAAAQQPAKPFYQAASTAPPSTSKPSSKSFWRCAKCGFENGEHISVCEYCGAPRP